MEDMTDWLIRRENSIGQEETADEMIKQLKTWLQERIKSVDKCYDELLTDMGEGIKIINVTGLSRKEKEEVINKRNCLIVQKFCYEEVLEKIK